MSLRIAILHNHVPENASASDRDVLVQVAEVENACRELGHTTWRLDCTLDLHAIHVALAEDRPDAVFNLVESLAGSDRLACLVPALLEALEIPFTGSSSRAIELSNCKPAAKAELRSLGLPTPDWLVPGQAAWPSQAAFKPPYIVKAIWEHASLGIDDGSIVRDENVDAFEQIAQRTESLGCPCFAEAFVTGREFNLSLLAGPSGVDVLPPAEIDFSAFPADKPRIVGYAAKWNEESFEFQETPRRFDFGDDDRELLDELNLLARRAWQGLKLQGYARVDFRVDADGKPWILEVNTNPCLSPDAGFAAAVTRAGMKFSQAVERLLGEALEYDSASRIIRGLTPPTRQDGMPAARQDVKLRSEARPADRKAVRAIVESTRLFRPGEVAVAAELVEDRLKRGGESEYQFVFADSGRKLLGYICFGFNEMTESSYEVYWIAVEPSQHGRGIGRLLLEEAERVIRAAGGKRLYIETSNRADYAATRGFYLRCGYRIEAILADYYAPADDKVVYVTEL